MTIVDADGDRCGPSSSDGIDIAVFGKVTAQTAVLDPPPVGDSPWQESCAAGDGPVYLQVTRSGDAFRTQQLPVELAFRLEPAVNDPGPAPVAEKSAALPAPAPGPARPVEAGSSFNDAPVLAQGSYADAITTGETRYFRVRLDWGQRLAYRITFPAQPVPIQTGALYVRLASPLRATADQTAGSTPSLLLGGRDDQEISGSSAVPVRWRNRDSEVSAAEKYAVDGAYYLVLDLSYRIGGDAPVSFPFTITVATSGGEPGPTYLSDPTAYGGATPSPSASATPEPSQAAPPAGGGSGDSGPATWVLAAAGAGAVLVAGAVALPWWRRRRRPAAGPAAGRPLGSPPGSAA